MQLHPLSKILVGKIEGKFGKKWLDLVKFYQIWPNLDEIWAKVIRFGQIWLDLGKI